MAGELTQQCSAWPAICMLLLTTTPLLPLLLLLLL
jgi:hypothetical protein